MTGAHVHDSMMDVHLTPQMFFMLHNAFLKAHLSYIA